MLLHSYCVHQISNNTREKQTKIGTDERLRCSASDSLLNHSAHIYTHTHIITHNAWTNDDYMNVLTQVHKWQWSRHAGYCEKICKSPSLPSSSSQSAAEAAELILSITSHIMMVGQIRWQVKDVSSLITNSQYITTHTTFLQMSFKYVDMALFLCFYHISPSSKY